MCTPHSHLVRVRPFSRCSLILCRAFHTGTRPTDTRTLVGSHDQNAEGFGSNPGAGNVSSNESCADRTELKLQQGRGSGRKREVGKADGMRDRSAASDIISHSTTNVHADVSHPGTIWSRLNPPSTAITIDTTIANIDGHVDCYADIDAFDAADAMATDTASQISIFDRQTNGSVKQYLLGLDATANAEAAAKSNAAGAHAGHQVGVGTDTAAKVTAAGAAAAAAGLGAKLSVTQVGGLGCACCCCVVKRDHMNCKIVCD